MAKARGNARLTTSEPAGLWHQPAFMNLLADLLIVLATAALAWATLTALQRLPLFPLHELVISETPQRVSSAQLEHAARAAVDGNFFTVDLDATRKAFEQLPWVRKAALSRQWPDGLKLTLEEHEARARWLPLGHESHKKQDEALLVNRQGEIFHGDANASTRRLPQLSGPDGSAPELLQRYQAVAQALAETHRQVATLTLSPRHAWRVELDNGMRIDLGRDQERHPLDERLARFVSHHDYIASRGRHVDMRYPNGFAISGAVVTPRPAAEERKS
jgi:cell division protein FtsQ